VSESTNEGYEVVEAVTDGVTDDGIEVFEDLVTVSDADGNLLAVDDTVGAVDEEGNAIIDETLAVADENGDLQVVSETVDIIEASDDED
jgi:hypothetical protein